MTTIKTYDHVNRQDHSLSFSISRTEDIYARHEGKVDEPHRHDFYTIVLVKSGKGEHVIDFNAYAIEQQQIFFINPGQVHQMKEEEATQGYAITFSVPFLIHNAIQLEFIENLNLFHEFGYAPPLALSKEDLSKLVEYAEEMIQVNSEALTYKYETLGALLKLLLIRCNQACTVNVEEHTVVDSAHQLLSSYKQLLDSKYKEWHGVSEYAEELHVSADHLNRVIKGLTGKTAKEHIQSRITVAAKRLLFFSSLSNKELAWELGFSEPANFSAFFKKCTGLSPSEFRKNEGLTVAK